MRSRRLFDCVFGGSRSRSVVTSPPDNKTAPIVQRTNGVVVPPAGFRTGRTAVIPHAVYPDALFARYRAHPLGSRTTFAPTNLIRLSANGRNSLHGPERRYSFRSQS